MFLSHGIVGLALFGLWGRMCVILLESVRLIRRMAVGFECMFVLIISLIRASAGLSYIRLVTVWAC